ncbi:major facilitator superfamily domain-containing protein 4A, partial [Nephila pilipes]
AIHFFYGVGAFLSPMIAQPFLLNEDCSPFISNTTFSFSMFENESLPAATLAEARAMTHIDYAFLIMALTMVPVVILTFTLLGRKHCLRLLGGAPPDREEKQNKEYESMEESDGRSDSDRIPKSMAQIVVVTVLSAILMFLYDGLQVRN